MEAAVRKWLCEDWRLSELHNTIRNVKEYEVNKTIMFRIGKLLGGKVMNYKEKSWDRFFIYKFDIIYNGENEKYAVKFSVHIDSDTLESEKIGNCMGASRRIELMKQLVDIYLIIGKTHREYDTYPIYRKRQCVLLILLARRDKNSILSTLPKDILILIAKKI